MHEASFDRDDVEALPERLEGADAAEALREHRLERDRVRRDEHTRSGLGEDTHERRVLELADDARDDLARVQPLVDVAPERRPRSRQQHRRAVE